MSDSTNDTTSDYPRPMLRRTGWTNLNGAWDFAIDRDAAIRLPEDVTWDRTIVVPFSPETPASGVHDQGLYCAVWYRRTFEAPVLRAGETLKLNFGAVDYAATVWVNGVQVCQHEGGYTPFSAEIEHVLREGGPQEIVVRAEDDPLDLEKPRGKQDWKAEAHSIWYPRTTGIWQTVWLEVLPAAYISAVRWTSNLTRWEIGAEILTSGRLPRGAEMSLTMTAAGQVLAEDRYGFVAGSERAGSFAAGQLYRRIALSDPGIDDFRNELLWSPSNPTLIEIELKLLDAEGTVLDEVSSYTALRSIAIQGDRFVLNGRPLALHFLLDQGYWPETGLSAPSSEAFELDVLLVKQLGFNGVRKHQKIEDPRFLYWADRLGLLVWEEMPSAYRYTKRSIERVTREWMAAVDRDLSHPCIVSWVPLNESWGVPDLPDNPAQRNYVQALYHLTRTVDPDRPVIGNDGWESVATDIIGIHDYDADPAAIAARYGIDHIETRLFDSERPGGRILRLEGQAHGRQPIVLTEFGGISLKSEDSGAWGYSTSRTPEEFAEKYGALMKTVRALTSLAGFCYTQFTDTYQETNGLLYADRTPKVPLATYRSERVLGCTDAVDKQEQRWRERLMELQAAPRK